MLRRIWIVGLAGAAVVAAAPATLTAASADCRVRDGRILHSVKGAPAWQRGSTVYACRLRYGRRVVVGRSYESEDVADVTGIRISGRFVAAEISCSCRSGSFNTIVVKDLKTGRRRLAAPTGEVSQATRDAHDVIGPATDLVLTAKGSVAWIAFDAYSPEGMR